MKRTIGLLTIFTLLTLLIGCKGKDKTPPKIFLNGYDPVEVILQTHYQDAGAYADDNYDGADISNRMTITHDIEGLPTTSDWTLLEGRPDKSGTYTITYTVTDEAGNTATATRTVIVFNQADKFAVTYIVNKFSQENVSPDYTNKELDIGVDTKVNNRISINKLSNIAGLKINLDIRDSLIITGSDSNIVKYIDIPSQTIEGISYNGGTHKFNVYGVENQSYFLDTTIYEFRIKYTIDDYKWNTGVNDYQLFEIDECVETFEKK